MVTDLIPGPKKPKMSERVSCIWCANSVRLGTSKFICTGCYDWGHQPGADPADARRLGRDAVTHNFCNQGFHDQPCLAEGKKSSLDNHEQGAAVWARWNAALQRFQMSEAKQRVVDQRWDNFCKGSRRSCTAKPFASGGSMTGEDWYVLAQQGEWIFDGLLRGQVLEYVVTLCILFRLMAAPKQNPARLATMMTLCDRPLQFHRLQHGVESVKNFGPMFIYWCFRAERTMGRLVKMVRRRNGVEAPGRRSGSIFEWQGREANKPDGIFDFSSFWVSGTFAVKVDDQKLIIIESASGGDGRLQTRDCLSEVHCARQSRLGLGSFKL
eukprot:g7422.t1